VAKGGGKGRNYVRDGRGRFASTPGGGGSSSSNKPARKGRSASTGRPQPRTFRQRGQAQLDRRPGQGGYLGKATKEAKARLKASKAKLKAKPSAQQRAAVTRAQIRAEGASPVTRLKRSATPGVLKGVKVTRAKGARGKGKPATPESRRPYARKKSADRLQRYDATQKKLRGMLLTGQQDGTIKPFSARENTLIRRSQRLDKWYADNWTWRDASKASKGRASATRPQSKPLPPGSRRKVRGPIRQAPGTIAKPKGLKPGVLAERRKGALLPKTGKVSFGSSFTSPQGKYTPGGVKSIPPPINKTGKAIPVDKAPASRAERIVRRMAAIGANRTGTKKQKALETQMMANTFLKFMSGPARYSRGSQKGMPRPNSTRLRELWTNLSDKQKVAEYGALVVKGAKASGLRRRRNR